MLESKFFFISRIFFLAFIIINIPNFFPLAFSDTSYWFLILTTISDTATLLVLSLAISKYINLKNMKLIEGLNTEDNPNRNYIERINIFKTKIIQDRKISFVLFIFFLISTLLQPIILVFDINKNDIYSTVVIESINKDFDDKKMNIEKIISIQKKQPNSRNEVNNLKNSISNLSNMRDKNIEQFLKTNTKGRFNSTKILIRNIILGILWAFVFYKFYII